MTAAESPAALCRRAANKLQALAGAPGLTPPPWLSMDGGDRLVHDPGHDDDPPVYVVDEPMNNPANAAFIATMHPGVGLELAAALEAAAADFDMCERINSRHPDDPGGTRVVSHPLAGALLEVARRVLGEVTS